MATQAYRQLMRAANITFQGDAFTLRAAQTQIRTQFRQKLQTLDPADSDGIKAALTQAEEVARFLRENVVQGKRVEGTDESYKLRIHEHTERGDNESIKTAGSGNSASGGCGCR